MSVYYVHVWSPRRPGEAVGSPGTRLTEDCELPRGYWEPHPGPRDDLFYRVFQLFYVCYTQSRVIKSMEPQLRKCLYKIRFPLRWKVQFIAGGAAPGLLVLGSIRKQAEQASKQYPSMASASAPASGVLHGVSSCPDFL